MNRLTAFVVMLASLLFLNVNAFAKDAATSTSTASDSNTTEVKGYTRADGTKVKGYTRTKKTAAPTADTQQVKGYRKADGTVVKGYTRKKATKSTSK
jgi:hypothetical protein